MKPRLLALTLSLASALSAQTVVKVSVDSVASIPFGTTRPLTALATFADGVTAVWAPIVPTALALVAAPDTGTAGIALAPITIQVMDSSGRPGAVLGAAIRVAKASTPKGVVGALAGTLLVSTTQEGRATFADLKLNAAGNYTLIFTMSTTAGDRSVTTKAIVLRACALAKRKAGAC